MKECKRHKWRVGSKNGELFKGQVIVTSLNIWCERCDKKIKVNYFSDLEMEEIKSNKVKNK